MLLQVVLLQRQEMRLLQRQEKLCSPQFGQMVVKYLVTKCVYFANFLMELNVLFRVLVAIIIIKK